MAPKPKARKSGPKGGRPSKMNPDKVRRVEEMKACGISDEAIAGELRVSRTTLLKHYAGALNKGRERRQAELNEIIWREARAGKSWAVKLLDAKMQAVAAEDSFLSDEELAPTRKPKLGKKEEAQLAAESVVTGGSQWGTDLMVPGLKPN